MSKKYVPVVAVLNMKGGVGKTTMSANLFRRLYWEKEKNCLLLDLDPQFNLTQTLFKKPTYEAIRKSGSTIAKVFGYETKAGLTEISDKHKEVPNPGDLARQLKSFEYEDEIYRLQIVPGDFSLVRYSLMDEAKVLKASKERFSKFVERCKEQNDLVVLDCNPSSSFLTTCAIEACTHILVPVRLDRYSVIGLEMLWEFVHEILPLNPKPEFVVLINGSRPKPTKAMIETEAELRGHSIFGSKTLGYTIRDTGQLNARSDYTGFAADRPTSVRSRIQEQLNLVANELAPKIGLK